MTNTTPTNNAPTNELYGTVLRVERLTPRLVRVVLGGEGLDGFSTGGHTDSYFAVLILPDDAPFEVPFDPEVVRDAGFRAARRRYTVREWDPAERELTVDFVVHGDVGVAGRWAERAQPGDRLQLSSATGGYVPPPDVDWYLMIGDESALPAIAASLEVLPAGAPAIAVLLVDDADHEIALDSEAALQTIWVHRSGDGDPSDRFVRAVTQLARPPGRVSAFVHGEAAETRAARRVLLGDWAVPREDVSVSPYWRRGKSDEAWREVKRDWLVDQETDVPSAS